MLDRSDRYKMIELTENYSVRPDPTGWLVAADLWEEGAADRGCDPNKAARCAAKWRARGRWFPAMRAAFDAALRSPKGSSVQALLEPFRDGGTGPFLLRFRRLPGFSEAIGISVRLPGGDFVPLPMKTYDNEIWQLHVKDTYVNVRIVRLIDHLAQTKKQTPGGGVGVHTQSRNCAGDDHVG